MQALRMLLAFAPSLPNWPATQSSEETLGDGFVTSMRIRWPGVGFAVATLVPLGLLLAGGVRGGVWIWAALAAITLVVAALDALSGEESAREGQEFPAQGALSFILGLGHFAVLALTVVALSGPDLSTLEKLGLFTAAGLFLGQISNSNAHELIHRSGPWQAVLGRWIYISVLFGHHASAHRLVHHVHVATPNDPNSAPFGMGFYRFLPRAWWGSLFAGWRAEQALSQRSRAGRGNPYWIYAAGSALGLITAALYCGAGGVAALLALSFYAQAQLLLSDYVQHYGLQRGFLADGRREPVGPQHSWNAPHFASGLMMLNAPRHSDHHAHPARAYPVLRLPAPSEAPTLPHALPVMACLALVPPIWRRMMDRRAEAWAAPAATAAPKKAAA